MKIVNKKALSSVVTTLILVGLSMVAVAVVWVSTSGMIKKQINNSESCYGINERVTLNSVNTCYSENAGQYSVRFEVDTRDIELDELIVAISYGGELKSYRLNTTNQTITGLTRYPNVAGKTLTVPGKNEGYSYNASTFTSIPDSIELIPIMNNQQCAVADSVSDIANCDLFV
jgi:hypothetical protein